MPKSPEKFYTEGAEEFAENHRLDDRPGVKGLDGTLCLKMKQEKFWSRQDLR